MFDSEPAHASSTRGLVLAAGLAAAALVMWLAGFVAIGQHGEDLCLVDAPAGAGSYRGEASWFPPSVTCVYQLSGGGVTRVDHALYASARTLWAFGFPVLFVLGLTVTGSRRLRRRRRS